ncbi:MAG: peptidoglycan DD-metalloendopeptidase family protein [Kiloniellales bacterium]|nr:peptidoglycan DD-metalloendopeptidase family protein [Kiloniellales bacterium]
MVGVPQVERKPGFPRGKRRRFRAGTGLAALMLAGGALSAGPVAAQQENDEESARLRQIEQELEAERNRAKELGEKANSLEAEVGDLHKELVDKGRSAQTLEDQLSAVETTLARLQADEQLNLRDLEGRHDQMVRTLSALQRIALQPPELAFAVPGRPLDAVRSAMLLKVAVAEIDERAEVLRNQLDELRSLRSEIALRREELKKVARELEAETVSLAALTKRKEEFYQKASRELDETLQRAAKRAAEAENLRGLVERLEQESLARAQAARQDEDSGAAPEPSTIAALAKPLDIRPFPSVQSSLVMPARGRLTLRYGERSDGNPGATSKGIMVSTRAGAQVVAPYDGRIVYSGEFRGYGQLLIIEHGGRYHSLLAGVERLNAAVGQWVLAGEPVGVMGRPQNGKPELYYELRRTGQPINPLPWLANIDDKVQG